jgi:hypothetical protein
LRSLIDVQQIDGLKGIICVTDAAFRFVAFALVVRQSENSTDAARHPISGATYGKRGRAQNCCNDTYDRYNKCPTRRRARVHFRSKTEQIRAFSAEVR